MEKGNLSRRGFLSRSLAALTVGAGVPTWYAKEVLAAQQENQPQRAAGANARLTMAAIGVGFTSASGQRQAQRGVAIMRNAMAQPGVQFVAVCDVDRTHAEQAAAVVGRDCRTYRDFRELLQRDDIDAITIGTPDHWHTLIAIEAMRRGKDVYCEKPLTLTVAEGKALVRVSQQTGKVLQTGSQQRSEYGGKFRLACELVRNGRIGRVQRIETRVGSNPVGGPFPTAQAPENLDWDFWLGQTPRVDFVQRRCHYEFRWWYEYSGGKMTDWGAHHNDIAQWALDMDNSGPIAVEGRGTAPATTDNSYNCHPNFEVTYTYGNGPNGSEGTRLVCSSQGENGILFVGENDRTIFVSRGALRASDPRIIEEPLPSDAVRLGTATDHMRNFMDCIRSRQQPICNPVVGHRSVTVCHIGNIAVRLGRRLRWNPREERFEGDDEANRMLSRDMRAPWRLEAST